jgi:hypothetical protein
MLVNGILISGPSEVERKPSSQLGNIIQELEDIVSGQSCDAFVLYLYGFRLHS